MASSINASTTAGVVTTADTSGVLNIQTAGTTAIAIDASQAVSFTNAPTVTGGTANGVAYLNGSKVLTTGSALVFNGSNLGINVTPSAWQGNNRAIQVNGGYASLSGNSSQGTCDLSYNCYNSTAQAVLGWKYTNSSAAATLYQQLNGAHAWHIAPSGTADAGVTFTQAMTLDASGNLLVGTTSAVATATRAGFYNAGSASPVVGVQNARNVSGDFVNSWLIGSNCQNTSSYFLTCGVSGVANVLYIYGNGNVQNTNNSYGAISDVKLKENIVDATPKLADLMQVKVRNYNLIGSTTKQIGVVAQELETIFPGLIDESPDYEPQIKTREVEVSAVAEVRDNEGNIVTEAVEATTKTEEYTEQVALGTTTKAVKYSVFVPMLIKAMQEQQAIILQLQADVAALKGA